MNELPLESRLGKLQKSGSCVVGRSTNEIQPLDFLPPCCPHFLCLPHPCATARAMQVERAPDTGWSFRLRDDEDSDSDGEADAPRAPPGPQTELDRLIEHAEVEGLDEEGEARAVDGLDIGAVDEAPGLFTETPWSISARLAATRKRNRLEDDDVGGGEDDAVAPKVPQEV